MTNSSVISRRTGIAAAFLVATLFAVLQAIALRAHPASCPPLRENAVPVSSASTKGIFIQP